jgi:glutathione S-transferase
MEPARLMLELAGAPYEVDFVALESWVAAESVEKERALKHTPFGQLPLLEDGDLVLCQSQAINRYLARKLGLFGSTAEEQARIDEVAETAHEIFMDIAIFHWDPQFAARRPEHREAMTRKLQRLDAYFDRTSKDGLCWVLPGRPTLADAAMAFNLESILPLHPGLLETFPRLHRAVIAFFDQPGVREYVRGPRRPRTFTVSLASFAGKPEETHHWGPDE